MKRSIVLYLSIYIAPLNSPKPTEEATHSGQHAVQTYYFQVPVHSGTLKNVQARFCLVCYYRGFRVRGSLSGRENSRA